MYRLVWPEADAVVDIGVEMTTLVELSNAADKVRLILLN